MQRLTLPDGIELAYRHSAGEAPTVVFLPGFRSDMTGTKASFLEEHCRAMRRGYLRFDYRGHGASSGRFEDCCIGDWKVDALAMLDQVVRGPALLVGSSMGGWIALLCARDRVDQVRGLVLLAPAPDFTERLIWKRLDEAGRRRLLEEGMIREPSPYGEPVPITHHLIEEGRSHLLLDDGPIPIRCPVHILHGQQDEEVPFQLSLELAEKLETPQVTVELVKDGDHRLSRPEDLRRLARVVDEIWDLVR